MSFYSSLLLFSFAWRVPPYFLTHAQGFSSVSQTESVQDVKPLGLQQSGKTWGGPRWKEIGKFSNRLDVRQRGIEDDYHGFWPEQLER